MSIDLRHEIALFLGNVNGHWARTLREKLDLDIRIFWGAVGIDADLGKCYEMPASPLPVVVVTSIVYVHLCQQPMIFGIQDTALKDALICAISDSRGKLSDEDRRTFLTWHQ